MCISILHPPVDDPQSGELPSERWNPTQNVRLVLPPTFLFFNHATQFHNNNQHFGVDEFWVRMRCYGYAGGCGELSSVATGYG